MMSKHICNECKYQYFYIYKPKMACMNEKSERYGEAIEPNDYCEEWQDWKDQMWAEAVVTEPQTEDEILREQCRAFMGIVELTEREGE